MKITEDMVVSVNYHLTASINGGTEELVEQTSIEQPFVFLCGFGAVLPQFEENLSGKEKGHPFDFKIDAANAYGAVEADYVVNISKQAFEIDGKFDEERIRVGEDIPMNDAEGNQLLGKVVEVSDAHVRMDFNHPLAGHDLHFVGEVLDVRPATQEELDHGHVHGVGGHHH
ncbi:MAG: FKBP-type peptidyl-prolyl cis-trans isomerase [Sediminibacterium sp.]|nr:FKBP-type peptidyl-prolyl cis-trans isomerase [Sediminibacterium sp.]